MPGGNSTDKPADDVSQKVFDSVRSQISDKTINNGQFKIISYTTQIVAGTNYNIKFTSGDNTYTAKIFVPLPNQNASNELLSIV